MAGRINPPPQQSRIVLLLTNQNQVKVNSDIIYLIKILYCVTTVTGMIHHTVYLFISKLTMEGWKGELA